MTPISISIGLDLGGTEANSDILVQNNFELETGSNFLLETGSFLLLEA